MEIVKRIFLVGLCLCCSSIYGKRFTSQFCEFELPPGWECGLEGSEWVCQSTNEARKKEAIIILAAKERGENDTLDDYQSHLKEKKVFKLPGGKSIVSEPSYTKTMQIHGHTWIDSLHLQSEIPGFYTQYLATVKEKLGVAVTFSVAKDHYPTYRGLFDKMIATLRVFAPSKYSSKGTFTLAPNKDLIQDTPFVSDDSGIPTINTRQQKARRPASSTGDSMGLVIIALLAGAGIFVVMKLKKKKNKS